MYGWLTNTGVKFVVVVDMEGRPATALDSKTSTAVGLRDADLKPVSIDLLIGDPLLTDSRLSERYRQHILCSYGIHSTTPMSTLPSQPMLSKELVRRRSLVEILSKRSRGSEMHGRLVLRTYSELDSPGPMIPCGIFRR